MSGSLVAWRPVAMMSRASRSPALPRWVGAFLASAVAVVVVGLAGLVVGEATASAVGTTYAYDTAAYVYAAPARLLPPDTVARDVRGSPSGPGAASWGRSVSVGGDVVAANTVDDILPTPRVSSQGLQNHIDALYKGTTNPSRVGNGTTMDAIRNELATGVPTAGRMHSIKGQERLNGLNNWLRRNPDVPYYDRLVAQSLADELSLVLRGGG